ELAALLVVDAHAGHVAGQQVGRELDALEATADRAGQRLGEHGLADAWHVLEEQVPAAGQRDQRLLYLLPLADDYLLDVSNHRVEDKLRTRHALLPPAALFEFLPTATGAGVVAPDLFARTHRLACVLVLTIRGHLLSRTRLLAHDGD